MPANNDRTALQKFLVPEAELSLKLIFDNLRNYVIGASLLALGSWFQRGAPGLPGFASGSKFSDLQTPLAFLSYLVGALLLILNLWQTFDLFWRSISPLMEMHVVAAQRASSDSRWLRRNAKRLLVALSVAITLACFTLLFATILFVMLYLVLFSSYAARSV